MRKACAVATAVVVSAVIGLSCSSPQKQYSPIPIELRVIHVESNRANYPREMFTGPLPGQVEAKAVPGMMEAIAVIAQAVSDCFKWGFQSASYQSAHAVQIGFISVDVVSLKWGFPKEIQQARMAWREHERLLALFPATLPMYNPNPHPDPERSMTPSGFMGWSDDPRVAPLVEWPLTVSTDTVTVVPAHPRVEGDENAD